ncbi:MAG: hypothetical protein Q7U13_02130 [Rhodoferax sp.]|nr:hypothetical protein [Rhodoferax sp.]
MNAHFLFDVFQFLVVAVLVLGCGVYCLLTLAPDIVKRPLRQLSLRCPLPAFVIAKLRQPTATGACGSSCGACPSGAATPQAVKWHPRKP